MLRALERHGSTLPSHGCLVLLGAAFCGTPPSYTFVTFRGSLPLQIPKCLENHRQPSYFSWSSWLQPGKCKNLLNLLLSWSLCTAIEPNDNIPTQGRCQQQACDVFILSRLSLKTLNLYTFDYSNTIWFLYWNWEMRIMRYLHRETVIQVV